MEINPSEDLINAERQNVHVPTDSSRPEDKILIELQGDVSGKENGISPAAETNGALNGDAALKTNISSDLESSKV